MKLVIAIIHPEQLPAVKKALFDAQIHRFTAQNVKGTAKMHLAQHQMYRGVDREVDLFNRVRLEIAVNDAFLEATIEAICAGANESGEKGIILVHELLDAIVASTGERGPRAIA